MLSGFELYARWVPLILSLRIQPSLLLLAARDVSLRSGEERGVEITG